MNERRWSHRAPAALALCGAAYLFGCNVVLGLRDIGPEGPDSGLADASDGGADTGDAPASHAWKSGFLLRSVIDDTYTAQGVDNAQLWYANIGTWRTASARNNCAIFNAIAYPDPGQLQTILDYDFGTLNGTMWGTPARFVPSSVGLQPLWSTPLTNGNDAGLKDTNAGSADDSLHKWFGKLVAYGQPEAIIRLGWGMGGGGYPWAIAASVNTEGYGSVDAAAAAYKTAYRRVVDIARTVAGQRFTFEWNATFVDATYGATQVPAATVAAAYPGGPDSAGRDYVDFIGLDLYDQSRNVSTLVQGTGSMTAGSLVVTGWTGPAGRHFAATDVGKSIQVYTAGLAGGASTDYPLFAKIVSVDASASPPTVALDVPAARAATNVMINLFDAWPTSALDAVRASLAAFAAFGKAKGKPLGVSEWAPMLRMDGHGGNDDPAYIQLMYDFFRDPANDVAYETLYDGLDGSEVGPTATSILYPMIKQSAGNKNGPFHDGTDALPQSVAKYHELFGPL